MRKKMLLLALALAALVAAAGPAPTAEATSCYWYCDANGQVHCSCGYYRNCPWPPPPIACP